MDPHKVSAILSLCMLHMMCELWSGWWLRVGGCRAWVLCLRVQSGWLWTRECACSAARDTRKREVLVRIRTIQSCHMLGCGCEAVT